MPCHVPPPLFTQAVVLMRVPVCWPLLLTDALGATSDGGGDGAAGGGGFTARGASAGFGGALCTAFLWLGMALMVMISSA
jgi:hypothetical protein